MIFVADDMLKQLCIICKKVDTVKFLVSHLCKLGIEPGQEYALWNPANDICPFGVTTMLKGFIRSNHFQLGATAKTPNSCG